MNIQTINPSTEQILQNYECLNEKQINEKLNQGHEAYLEWKKTSFSQRKTLMIKLAKILKENVDELAQLMSLEMGKPITAGKAEINKCAWLCEYFAEQAEHYLAPKVIQTDMRKAKVCYQPLGMVFAIMPWNFPFWQVFRFAVPALMSGNAAVLKHAPISSGTGNKIEQLFLKAGFPQYVFQHFIVDNAGAAKIIEHPSVIAVTLTGSGRAGSDVASHAGKFLKKTVLELGGNDPYLVLEDADLDLAARCIVNSRLHNSGQVCIAAKRIIVLKSVEKELVQKIIEQIALFKMGDPLNPETNLGPLARSDLRDTLHKQVEKSLKQGAKLLLGGIIPEGQGFYYPPTLLTNVTPGMTAFDEELFGPVIAIIPVNSEKEAIAYANQSQYGLGSAVFTRDLDRGEHIATYEIE
ncbi:MAG: NAD-dependent succinate-semialdehyde dehydrogenase, partial [Legionella longbeachae]|nr:NAD-dependent succinate-semialdehyde dehydrogenase [Legionella longbeachae]